MRSSGKVNAEAIVRAADLRTTLDLSGEPGFEDYGASLQKNLRLLRKAFGFRATDVAEFCNVTRQTVLNIENGSTTLKKPMYMAILGVMGYNKAKYLSNPFAIGVWEWYIFESKPPSKKIGLFKNTFESFIENYYQNRDCEKCMELKLSWPVIKNMFFEDSWDLESLGGVADA